MAGSRMKVEEEMVEVTQQFVDHMFQEQTEVIHQPVFSHLVKQLANEVLVDVHGTGSSMDFSTCLKQVICCFTYSFIEQSTVWYKVIFLLKQFLLGYQQLVDISLLHLPC